MGLWDRAYEYIQNYHGIKKIAPGVPIEKETYGSIDAPEDSYIDIELGWTIRYKIVGNLIYFKNLHGDCFRDYIEGRGSINLNLKYL